MELSADGLENKWVRLERMTPSFEIYEFVKYSGAVEAMWQWMPRVSGWGVSFEDYFKYVSHQIKNRHMIAYLARSKSDDAFVGGAAFLRASRTHRSVQIGYIWTPPSVRGSKLPIAIQAAMIQRAIDWRAKRIYWVVDVTNTRYSAFLERKIGAIKEGQFESFARLNNGRWCDAAVYALAGDKLNGVVPRLEAMLEAKD